MGTVRRLRHLYRLGDPTHDAVITESHLAESMRKMKRLDDLIERPIHSLRDFRNSAT